VSQERASELDVKSDDGRILRVQVSGDRNGVPIFLLHGTPGSRSGPRPRHSVLYRLGVQLISYDRPGYGGSTRQPDRKVVDAAHDVARIATELKLGRFAVVGRSGGGPHALACAAKLTDQLVRVAVLVSLAPAEAGLDWFQGMTSSNVHAYQTADADSPMLTEQLRLRADRTLSDPQFLLNQVRTAGRRADIRVVDDVAMRRLLADTYVEGLKEGPYGWIDDVFALRQPWGFDLAEIKVPVRLWHGEDDSFSPVSHTRWIADRIPGAEMQVQPGAAHFGAVEILPQILAWLKAGFVPTPENPTPENPTLETPTIEQPSAAEPKVNGTPVNGKPVNGVAVHNGHQHRAASLDGHADAVVPVARST
jgi:pimeloyl-ACP methyl ester carboxylesterase